MSPTIRSRGGQPLMTSGGLVAGSQACCCENPPPPLGFCACPGWCLYQLEVLSPVSWGPRPPRPCEEDVIGGVSQSDKFFFFEDGFYDKCEDPETCCGGVTEPVTGLVGPTVNRFYASIVALDTFSARVVYNSNLRAIADISVHMRCENAVTNPDSPGIYIDFYFSVFVPGLDGLVPIYPTRGLTKQATLKLTTHCKSRPSATCSGFEQKIYLFNTPITFTVSNESPGLTSWNPALTFDNSIGDQSRVTPCFNQLVDNFAATFRITSRPSCRDASCTCNSELYGLQLTLGYFTATIGEYYFYEDTITYRLSSALQNNGWSIVLWEKDADWRFIKMLRVDMYCDSSSGSPKWYAYIRTRCIEYDNQGVAIYDSTDSWMGTFDCYESCEFAADDSNGLPRSRAKGDPIPLGDVQNVEYLGRESIYPECNPPDLPVVRIGQVEAC